MRRGEKGNVLLQCRLLNIGILNLNVKKWSPFCLLHFLNHSWAFFVLVSIFSVWLRSFLRSAWFLFGVFYLPRSCLSKACSLWLGTVCIFLRKYVDIFSFKETFNESRLSCLPVFAILCSTKTIDFWFCFCFL